MSGWDLKADNGGGNLGGNKAEFTKFPVGVSRVRVVDEAPYTRWVHWMEQFKRSVNCPGRGCPICEIRRQEKANKVKNSKYGMARRIAINVYNHETERVEIMEQGVGFFEDTRDIMNTIREEFDEGKREVMLKLTDVDLKVRRRGTGKDDTSYRVDEGDAYPLTEEQLQAVEEGRTVLLDYFKPHTNEQILRLLNGEKWEDVFKSESTDETSDEPQEQFQVK